jgi:hypothetical protein
VLERIDLPIAHAEFDTERDMLSPDSGQIMTGQRLVQAVGGSTGCVVQTARRRARPDSARFVVFLSAGGERLSWNDTEDHHLVSVANDTLHQLLVLDTAIYWQRSRIASVRAP